MAATVPSTSLVPARPVFTDAERLALAGFVSERNLNPRVRDLPRCGTM